MSEASVAALSRAVETQQLSEEEDDGSDVDTFVPMGGPVNEEVMEQVRKLASIRAEEISHRWLKVGVVGLKGGGLLARLWRRGNHHRMAARA